MARKYDAKTHKWVKTADTSNSTSRGRNANTKSGDDSGLTSNNTNKKSAKGKTSKKINKKTIRTLEGSLNYLANENTIKIHPRDTIRLDNLGKYLSGKYYVSEVVRTISTSGYSQSATVLKTNFRKSLKIVAKKTTKGKK